MKSLTKKVLSLAMAIAMAGSCMAFAAETGVTIGEVVDEGTTTVNIPYTTTETNQLTVIVYEVEDENDESLPAVGTIGYINQFDAPAMEAGETEATGTVTFTMKDDFVAGDVLAEGTYKIIMGGSDVGETAVAYLVVGEEEVTVVPGDVFVDNIINSNDVTKIVDSLISGIALEGNEFIAADVYTDSIINSNDVTKIVDSLISGATLTFGK